jgi:hypothetical protein
MDIFDNLFATVDLVIVYLILKRFYMIIKKLKQKKNNR